MINNFMLPEMIFFTGVPGSRWSGIAQEIKSSGQYNCTDRAEHRNYTHNGFSGHCDAYYGTGMEFPCNPEEGGLDHSNLCAPYSNSDESHGCKLLMSHEWPYYFDEIMDRYPEAWIQLVYRPDWNSFLWWKQAGGFDITYPNYDWYESDYFMTVRIKEQNELILDFGQKHSVQWQQNHKHMDIFIGTYKP
jgi:hypothetical protein